MDKKRSYVAIDLKSFYASVECVELGLDPLNTNLVVADKSRTNKTICLAVSPSLKSFGVPGRPRLFEVEEIIKKVNRDRAYKAKLPKVKGTSYYLSDLENDHSLGVDYIVAKPRMAFYIEYSTRIYNTYLKYFSSEDIHVYSIDEVFIDVTSYLKTYNMTAHELAMHVIKDVLNNTGVTATAGIGTNMYLAKVAMDIVAKKSKADSDGVRIAELDELSYRELLWDHEPITDFWRVGRGYARRLENMNLHTMGDIARFSLTKDGELYDEFGINAELLIDHAWGYEPCLMEDIKKYEPNNHSISSGQVLMEPYTYDKARIVLIEMVDNLSLDLVDKGLMTNHLGIYVGYDIKNDSNNKTSDWYGRSVPKPASKGILLKKYTSSSNELVKAAKQLFDEIVSKSLYIRRINITFGNIITKEEEAKIDYLEQLDLFSDVDTIIKQEEKKKKDLAKEHKAQKAILSIKKKYGKNSILKGTNFEEGATGKARNKQIGGHNE